MRTFGWNNSIAGIVTLVLALCLTGCENGGGDDGGDGVGDVGSNNPNVYSCVGDSITGSDNGGGPPYPPRLAAMTGKTVANHGVDSETTGSALGRVAGILENDKPAALLILLGAVDRIDGTSTDESIANLRSMIQMAKANQTVAVVATLLPMTDSHEMFNGGAQALSARIRQLASEEGARLVDLQAEFGTGEGLMLGDGLHPNDAGCQLIADAFSGAL